MLNREKIVEDILHNMYAMRNKLIEGYMGKKNRVITPAQGFILHFIAKNNFVNIKTIAQILYITSSAATQLVNGLVDKGLLIRKNNTNDRRVITLSLSDESKKVLKKLRKEGLEKMTNLFGVLTDEELIQYASMNKKIFESITKNQNCI